MDFSFTDDQRAIADLAGQILTDQCSLERSKTIETSADGYDAALWAELAKAGLLGAAVPERHGGSGGGFLEICLILEQQGRRLADDMLSAKEITTAKYWAAEGGSRIGHAVLHIHGGIGIDSDYPIHRYFLWLKQIENTLGAATPQLVRLGALLAAEPA